MRKYQHILEFDTLTPDQKELLHEWFEMNYTYKKIAELMAAPAPDGFGITVSEDKVGRYWHRWADARDLSTDEIRLTVEEVIQLCNAEEVPFSTAGLNLIIKKAFDLARRHDQTPARLKLLMNILDYQRRLDLAERQETRKDRLADLRAEELKLRQENAKNRSSRHEAHSTNSQAHEDPSADSSRPPLDLETAGCGEIFQDLQDNPPATLHDPRVIAWQDKAWAIEGLTPDQIEKRRARIIADAEKEKAQHQAAPQENRTSPTSGPTPSRQVLECGGIPPLSSAPAATQNPPLPACPDTTHKSPLASCPSTPLTPQENRLDTPSTPTAPRQHPTLEQMAKASDLYARARVREWAEYTIAAKRSPLVHFPSYVSHLRQCPCGSELPCPWHEPFPEKFWTLSAFSFTYANLLQERGIPHTPPEDMLA